MGKKSGQKNEKREGEWRKSGKKKRLKRSNLLFLWTHQIINNPTIQIWWSIMFISLFAQKKKKSPSQHDNPQKSARALDSNLLQNRMGRLMITEKIKSLCVSCWMKANKPTREIRELNNGKNLLTHRDWPSVSTRVGGSGSIDRQSTTNRQQRDSESRRREETTLTIEKNKL